MSDAGSVADGRAAYAGFWRRFAAYAIDLIVLLFGTALGAAVIARTLVAHDGTPRRSTWPR